MVKMSNDPSATLFHSFILMKHCHRYNGTLKLVRWALLHGTLNEKT